MVYSNMNHSEVTPDHLDCILGIREYAYGRNLRKTTQRAAGLEVNNLTRRLKLDNTR